MTYLIRPVGVTVRMHLFDPHIEETVAHLLKPLAAEIDAG